MWVVYLEMAVALALAALIIWWTWPAKRGKEEKPADERGKDRQ